MDIYDKIFVGTFFISIVALVCWIRHIVWGIMLLATDTGTIALGKIVLAVLGFIIPPVGAIHGFFLFLGTVQ